MLRDCKKTGDEIRALYPEYDKAKKLLLSWPAEIAKIRENKDESETDDELVREVHEYKRTLDEVYDIFKTVNELFG